MKENLMRVIYCEMLGHDASFGFIHAVNYTQKGKLMDKRIGKKPSCLFLLFVTSSILYIYMCRKIASMLQLL